MSELITTELGEELKETLSRCATDAKVVSDSPNRIRLTDIPHSGTHMLPGGVSTLSTLGEHWSEWDVEYVENGDTVMYGSKADKDVIITRTA